jgi:predicted phage-related endonuclease
VTPEQKAAWLQLRCGNLGASRMADAMDVKKDGKPGAKRIALLKELLAERMTGDSVPHYVSDRMVRGLELEPQGKAEFELRTGLLLRPCGFVFHPSIDAFGATPDALIGADTVFEMKAPDTVRHIEYMMAGNVVPEQYRPQVLAQLACTGRERVMFASFDPRVLNERKRMHIVEWVPARSEIEAVEEAARAFLAELDQWWEALHTEREAA